MRTGQDQGAATMIARTWRGWTGPENADAYQQIVQIVSEVLSGIAARSVGGRWPGWSSVRGGVVR
jgi:hypothetical protein